jgi:hypothetical protein
MILQSPITPKSHPTLYREEEIAGYKYNVPVYIGLGLQEDLTDAYLESYRTHCENELEEGKIVEVKYNAWITTKEGKRITDRVAVGILFSPADDKTPPANTEDIYRFMDQEQFAKAFNFFKNPLPNNTDAPQSSSASGVLSPASETASSNL